MNYIKEVMEEALSEHVKYLDQKYMDKYVSDSRKEIIQEFIDEKYYSMEEKLLEVV